MRFDEDKSVDYNYEVGFLEGIRTASIQAVSTYVNEQVETVKEMDE